jgi:DNA-binding transcriptional LysR family regulator
MAHHHWPTSTLTRGSEPSTCGRCPWKPSSFFAGEAPRLGATQVRLKATSFPPMGAPRTRPPAAQLAKDYRLPGLLQDIRLLDLLELCGSTVETSRLLHLSQPTISRRYRLLAKDFGLVRDQRQLWGCGYGSSASMRLLRMGCRAHRLAAGVARVGSDWLHRPLLKDAPWLLSTPEKFRAAANWLELVRQGVLDGALVSGVELDWAEGINLCDLELLPVGEMPLSLGLCSKAPILVGECPEVLVPDRGIAPGLRNVLREQGLPVRSGGNSLLSFDQSLKRITATSRALVVAACVDGAKVDPRLRQLPLRLSSPIWLAMPSDWEQFPILRNTMERVRQALLFTPNV